MNLSNSNKLINFEIKKMGIWNEMREKVKEKYFLWAKNKDMKM